MRSLPPFIVPLLLAVAVAGYLTGLHRPTTRTGQVPAGGAQVASGVNVLLEYPRAWKVASAPTGTPRLELGARRLNLVPRDLPREAGLITGILRTAPSRPLPADLLAAQHGIPRTEVVNLISVQAFRYRHLIVPGYSGLVDLYVVPTPDYGATALVCYAAPGLESELSRCEQIVASVTLVGQSTSVLTPDVEYAHKLSTLLVALDRERSRLRVRLNRGPAGAAAGVAAVLAERFASTSTALAALEPPAVAGPAQVRLARSLLTASHTYEALASVAGTESATGYEPTRSRVQAAEAGVDGALEGFALLGYGNP